MSRSATDGARLGAFWFRPPCFIAERSAGLAAVEELTRAAGRASARLSAPVARVGWITHALECASVGHWFVGLGYDAGGIHIRDSSGWDTRYLSWSRLYAQVGFSGWVVGVA